MYFDAETLGTLKRQEQDAIASLYLKADEKLSLPDGVAKVEDFANKGEVELFIKDCIAATGGFPQEITEDVLADPANEALVADGVAVGDVIILPFPTNEEETSDDPETEEDGSEEADQPTDEEEDASEETAEMSNDFTDNLQAAIETGKLRFEGKLVIAARPKIVSGKLRFELDSQDSATYPATVEELEPLVTEVLTNKKD